MTEYTREDDELWLRILELRDLGHTRKEISMITGVPLQRVKYICHAIT